MNAITMNETQAQRDAERVREHAPKLLPALIALEAEFRRVFPVYYYAEPWAHDRNEALKSAVEAIEYATGAHDPDCYPEVGYEVDAAGTATGVSA